MSLNRITVIGYAFAALLAGCAGSQPPIGARGAMAQSPATAGHAVRGKSWMLPGAKLSKDTLIYVGSSFGSDHAEVFVYKTNGKLVQTFTGFNVVESLCSDVFGNVWISNSTYSSYVSTLIEYPHGGTTPIAALSNGTDGGFSCAVDPISGDLAVGNFDNVSIYKNATGTPTEYHAKSADGFFSASYDESGNLFLANHVRGGYQVGKSWLRRGASTISTFKTKPGIFPHDGLAWDGKYIVIGAHPDNFKQYALHGNKGIEVGSFSLCCAGYFSIHNSLLVTTDGYEIYLFKYPQGGSPTLTIPNSYHPDAVTISAPPSQ